MVKFDEFLHAVYFFVHFSCDEACLFFLPLPESDPLVSGGVGFAEGSDHGSICVDIER